MSKKKPEKEKPAPAPEQGPAPQQEAPAPEQTAPAPEAAPEEPPKPDWEEKYNKLYDSHLRLAAEYDNYRKRTRKEQEQSYTNGKSDTILKLLPIYDNLERALKQETQDAAFQKGVALTMTELMKILKSLGVEIFGEPGDKFDPQLHNAVMHVEDDAQGEGVIVQVFQKGFKLGDKIVRFAMVQVAN